jgi:hypothetical protein
MRSTKPLTLPDDVELHTSKRLRQCDAEQQQGTEEQVGRPGPGRGAHRQAACRTPAAPLPCRAAPHRLASPRPGGDTRATSPRSCPRKGFHGAAAPALGSAYLTLRRPVCFVTAGPALRMPPPPPPPPLPLQGGSTPWKSMAQKVKEFQSKTPARFRSQPAQQAKTVQAKTAQRPQITEAKVRSCARARAWSPSCAGLLRPPAPRAHTALRPEGSSLGRTRRPGAGAG